MKEYITKDRAKQFVCGHCNEACSEEPCEPSDCDWMAFIDKEPAADVVSKGLYEQIKWERDVALAQLEEYGVSLGEKADVATVQHGRWEFGKDLLDSFGSINKNKYHLYCSECRNQAFNKTVDNDYDFDMDTPFCPWCGAKMDKEEACQNGGN